MHKKFNSEFFSCKFPCSSLCPPCSDVCILQCNHSKCKKKCGDPCIDCKVRPQIISNFLKYLFATNLIFHRNVVNGVVSIYNVNENVRICVTGILAMSHVKRKLNAATIALEVVESHVLHFVVIATRTRYRKYCSAKKTKRTLGMTFFFIFNKSR